jgi:hypothetical protein
MHPADLSIHTKSLPEYTEPKEEEEPEDITYQYFLKNLNHTQQEIDSTIHFKMEMSAWCNYFNKKKEI